MKEQNTRKYDLNNFAGESEAFPESNWTTDSESILTDVKYLMKQYYFASFTNDGNGLKICFSNGQRFIISVTECT